MVWTSVGTPKSLFVFRGYNIVVVPLDSAEKDDRKDNRLVVVLIVNAAAVAADLVLIVAVGSRRRRMGPPRSIPSKCTVFSSHLPQGDKGILKKWESFSTSLVCIQLNT